MELADRRVLPHPAALTFPIGSTDSPIWPYESEPEPFMHQVAASTTPRGKVLGRNSSRQSNGQILPARKPHSDYEPGSAADGMETWDLVPLPAVSSRRVMETALCVRRPMTRGRGHDGAARRRARSCHEPACSVRSSRPAPERGYPLTHDVSGIARRSFAPFGPEHPTTPSVERSARLLHPGKSILRQRSNSPSDRAGADPSGVRGMQRGVGVEVARGVREGVVSCGSID
jgi:hypothetical protein